MPMRAEAKAHSPEGQQKEKRRKLDKREAPDWRETRGKPRKIVLSSPEKVAEHDLRDLGNNEEGELLKKLWMEVQPDKPLREMPLEIMIEAVGGVCNMHCPMCYLQSPEFNQKVRVPLLTEKSAIMHPLLYRKIITEIEKWNTTHTLEESVLAIKLGFRGEPTLDRDLLEKIRLARKAKIYHISFLTNGLIMTEEFFKKLIELEVNEVVFSGEGSDPGTYERVRHPAKWDDFIGKLAKFKKIRDDARAMRPAMRIQSVWPAISDNPGKYYDIFKDRVDLVESNALIDYLKQDGPDKIEYIPDFHCYEPFQRLIISANGQVLQCINDEYSSNFVGDLRTQTVYEAWHGEGLQKLRKQQIDGTATSENGACANCYLPRQIEWDNPIEMDGRKIDVFKYVNRAQEIGK